MTESESALGIALAGACLLCGAPSLKSGLCQGCFDSLPFANGDRCPVCAVASPGAKPCGRCLTHPPAYDRVVVALDYVSPVDFLIADLKYSRNLAAARVLAYLLAEALEQEPYPDFVLPMPVAASRLRDRGFNQASEIARHACAGFGLRVTEGLAQRTYARQSQTALPWRDRASNVRGAFRCETDITDKTIAVVDDVITTGATLHELATTLKRAGAEKVIGWIAARTPAQH
jgi:ComF family protein